MAIRKYKPTTPGRRGSSVSDFAELTRSTPEKSLLVPIKKTGGRNNQGRITTRHIGGGHKQAYRIIDFKRYDKDGVPAKVAHIEYDPNRTARIALLHYADGEKRYIIAPLGLSQGATVEAGEGADIKPGNNLPLRNIPVGTTVHAVEMRPGGGAKLGRSAGAKIALGSSVAAGPDPFMPRVAIEAIQTAKALKVHAIPRRSYPVLTPAEAWWMLTKGAAEALGLASRIGSIDVGMEADCLVVRPEPWIAELDPQEQVSALLYTIAPEQIEQVLVAGKQLVAE